MDVAGQPPQAAAANAGPEQQDGRPGQQQADDREEFSKLAHGRSLIRRSQFLKTLLERHEKTR
jgi:hypothetical protein